jgi:hypothetical protein
MNTKIKKILLTTTTTLSAILIVTSATYAIGTLTPSGTAGDNTQYSLNDIYTRLTTNATATVGSGSISTPGSVTASFRTLSEIYTAIPTIDATKVATGTAYLGVAGTLQQGTIFPTQWSVEDPTGYVTWATAVSYCDNLTENTHTDWRLPSYIELVNEYLTNGQGLFQGDGYWSSTEHPSYPNNVYYVYMNDGYASYVDKSNPNFLARCAR